jgi:hypothetical protein
MRTNFSQAAKIFFSPETLVPFLIGATFLSVPGNAVTQMLTNWLSTSSLAAAKITFGAAFWPAILQRFIAFLPSPRIC